MIIPRYGESILTQGTNTMIKGLKSHIENISLNYQRGLHLVRRKSGLAKLVETSQLPNCFNTATGYARFAKERGLNA